MEGEDWSYDVLDVGSGSGDDGSSVGRLVVYGPTLDRLVGVVGVGGKDDLALVREAALEGLGDGRSLLDGEGLGERETGCKCES